MIADVAWLCNCAGCRPGNFRNLVGCHVDYRRQYESGLRPPGYPISKRTTSELVETLFGEEAAKCVAESS